MQFFTLLSSIQTAVFSMKGGHYTKESIVLEQKSTASNAGSLESYQQCFPEDAIEYLESLFTAKG